jgi:hypothetical protein
MEPFKGEQGLDKRLEARIPYSGHIFFTAKGGFYEGQLKNYSRYGLFIETGASLSVGEVITVALPYLDHDNVKCKGQIMWCNGRGCGIELFRKRSDAYLRIVR